MDAHEIPTERSATAGAGAVLLACTLLIVAAGMWSYELGVLRLQAWWHAALNPAIWDAARSHPPALAGLMALAALLGLLVVAPPWRAASESPQHYARIAAAVVITTKVVYVGVELYYNRTLMAFIATPLSEEAAARNLRDLGHGIAAVGVTLVATTLLRGPLGRGILAVASTLTARPRFTAALSWLALFTSLITGAYHGQMWLMERAVERTGAQTRYEAYYLAIAQSLAKRDQVALAGLLEPGAASSYIERLATVGTPLLLTRSEGVPRTMRERAQPHIVRELKRRAYVNGFETHWEAYRAASRRFSELWTGYSRIMAAAALPPGRDVTGVAADAYEYLLAEATARAERYAEMTSVLDRSLAGGRSDNLDVLYDAHTRVRRAGVWGLQERYRERFNDWLAREMPGKLAPKARDWCDPDGTNCPTRKRAFAEATPRALRKAFNRAYGYGPDLSRAAFFRADAVKYAMATALADKGLEIAPERVYVFQAVRTAVRASLRGRIQQVLDQRLNDPYDLNLRPGMGYEQVMFSDGVQQPLQALFGTPGTEIELLRDKAAFFEHEWGPAVEARIRERLPGYLPTDAEAFEPGGTLEEQGKEAVKLLFVVPFALCMSALFAALNLLSLLAGAAAGAARLITTRRPAAERHRRAPATVVRTATLILGVGALATPLLFTPEAVQARPAVTQFAGSGVWYEQALWLAMKWLVSVEWLVLALGDALHAALPQTLSVYLDARLGVGAGG